MQKLILLWALLFYTALSHGQKLGFSTITPISQEVDNANGIKIYSTGEVLINTSKSDNYILHNGLLQQNLFDNFIDKFINVKFFFDENQNGVKDLNDIYFNQGAVTIGDLSFYNHKKEGITVVGATGDYDVKFENINLAGWFLTTPEEYQVTIDQNNAFQEISFGLAPETMFSDLKPRLSSNRFRCCTPIVKHTLNVTNEGTVIDEQTVWIKIDERISDVNYLRTPDTVLDSNYVAWTIKLYPGQSESFEYTVQVPCISDDIMVGEVFKTIAWVETADYRNEFCFEQELRCSYDPNDKLVHPNRPDSLALFGQELTYTLRFQNTGNDYAENVVVVDTISKLLDISTLKIIETSHPKQLSIEKDKDDDYIINFRFDDIYLPDSTSNPVGSNGHVMFSIMPFDGFDIGTEINNTAYIYFDFNPPIVTNTTGTTYVDKFPVTSTSQLKSEQFHIYPNPTTGIIYFEKEAQEVQVIDSDGRLVKQFYNSKAIDVSELASGQFFIQIKNDNDLFNQKIILAKPE